MTMSAACDIVLVAGGSGNRYLSELPKQFDLVHGRPLYLWSLDVFLNWKSGGAIVVVVPADWVEAVRESFNLIASPRLKVIAGGVNRQMSAKRGVEALADCATSQWVMIHDAARPLITEDLLDRLWEARRLELTGEDIGGIIPGVPPTETVKRVERHLHGAIVRETLERQSLLVIQTPQLLKREILLKAYGDHQNENAPDDAYLLERAGFKIMVVDGEPQNIKVTFTEDKERVSHWLRNRHPSP